MPEPTTATVYIPTLITSVEQAEQFPMGTVAYLPGTRGWVDTAAKVGLSDWRSGDTDPGSRDRSMLGWTALVPVTATFERMAAYAVMPDPEWDPTLPPDTKATRYTTPWTPEEEA